MPDRHTWSFGWWLWSAFDDIRPARAPHYFMYWWNNQIIAGEGGDWLDWSWYLYRVEGSEEDGLRHRPHQSQNCCGSDKAQAQWPENKSQLLGITCVFLHCSPFRCKFVILSKLLVQEFQAYFQRVWGNFVRRNIESLPSVALNFGMLSQHIVSHFFCELQIPNQCCIWGWCVEPIRPKALGHRTDIRFGGQ